MRYVSSLALPFALVGLVSFSAQTADAKPKRAKARTLKRVSRVSVPTTNKSLDKELRRLATKIKRQGSSWTFEYKGVQLMIITDERADRMRVVTQIASAKGLGSDALRFLLEANFDRALDAKYAIFSDVVWGVFVHPLSSLSKNELRSAIAQTARLSQTYGTTFSSTDVVFGG